MSYESIILVGDFNSEINDKCMNDFCESYSLSSLIRDSTCYKNPKNPSCIDLFLTNSPNSFQKSSVVETDLSDFHRMIVPVMKTSFQRLPPHLPKKGTIGITVTTITIFFVFLCLMNDQN